MTTLVLPLQMEILNVLGKIDEKKKLKKKNSKSEMNLQNYPHFHLTRTYLSCKHKD